MDPGKFIFVPNNTVVLVVRADNRKNIWMDTRAGRHSLFLPMFPVKAIICRALNPVFFRGFRPMAPLLLAGVFLCGPLSAREKRTLLNPPSVFEILGDGSHASVGYGYWYANWNPDFTHAQDETAEIEIEPALLEETSFQMQWGASTNFLVQYVADEILGVVKDKSEERVSATQRKVGKELLAQLKQQLPLPWLQLQGRAILGEFRARAYSPEISGGIYGASSISEGTYYRDVGVQEWVSEYQEYEANLILGGRGVMGRGGAAVDGGFAMGVRFIDYTRPVGVQFTPVENPDPNRFFVIPDYNYLVLSSLNGTYFNIGFVGSLMKDSFFFDFTYLYGIGGGDYKNDYMDDLESSGFYFDTSMKLGLRFLNLKYVDFRFFLGYRFTFNATGGGEIVDETANQKVTLTKDMNPLSKGTKGYVYFDQTDWFHGPLFGVIIRF